MKLEEIVLLGSRPQLRAGFQQICFVALISIRVFAFWANTLSKCGLQPNTNMCFVMPLKDM
ncbi:hypothetical protein GmHk_03G009028 [Glycine max]|nr:hypothetical protein GmHk_03G009028 [Glycine max]